MTELELKKLRRPELIEMMLDLNKENEVLRAQLDKAHKKLSSQSIAIEKSGSLAEAALQINGVFQAAQAACEQYEANIRERSAQQEEICARMEQETTAKCAQMERETTAKCAQMEQETAAKCAQLERETTAKCTRILAEAQQQADVYRQGAEQEIQKMVSSYSWLAKVLKEDN